jgi:outer membrane protein OmpA-like peptidoglycan-associated protein
MPSIRSVLIFLTFIALSIQALAQDDPKKLARDYFDQAAEILQVTKALDQARDLYVLAAETDTTFLKANMEAGLMHIRTIQKELAAKYFLRVYRQDPSFNFGIEYWIGKSYQFGLDFDRALQYFNLYKQKYAAKSNFQGRDKVDIALVDRAIHECNNGKKYVATPMNYSIVNIGREINSEYDDYAPVLSEKEDEIVFTSRRKDDNLNQDVDIDNLPFEDIFIAKKQGGTWSYAKNIGDKINTLYHNSNLAISADGQLLFIVNDENGGDIYYCELQSDGTFGEPKPLPGGINSTFQEASVSISKDETALYFSSDRPGGYGGKDIYKAVKNSKGEWGSVKNLGTTINTAYDDDGPFIDYDGVTLFFSSKGHDGMGGFDIYRTKFDAATNKWDTPVNLGYPINTPDNDVYFIASADTKRAYYSSVRDDGQGYLDIYVITASEGIKNATPVVEKKPEPPVVQTPPPVVKKDTVVAVVKKDPPKEEPKVEPKKEPVVVPKKDPIPPPKKEPVVAAKKEIKPLKYVVSVVDAESKSPLNAKTKLVGQRDNIIVASTNSKPGVYEFNVTNATAKDYRLSVEIDGYVFLNQNLKLDGASEKEKTVTRTVEMRKIAIGVTSVLRNLYFDYDKWKFKTESYTELNKLESMLRQNQNMKIEISGHTDNYGKWDYNKFLSQRRAEAVKDYLTKKGIDPRRVKATGYGETKPLASNDDENGGRELNRRVEFKVLQK